MKDSGLGHPLSIEKTSELSPWSGRDGRSMPPFVRKVTMGLTAAWLVLVMATGWWISQRMVAAWLMSLDARAKYETQATARVVDRLFSEMVSVANMVARQGEVIQLAIRYRTDPPGFTELTREQRAAQFTRDPLVRKVGDFMNALSTDLRYARIYMNNLTDDTVTASNWAEPGSIVGMIYSDRTYLSDALRNGNGHSFGIARLNKSPSYFVSSRINDQDDMPLGTVTVRFDAPDMARYLTGANIALIVNRQGRVTTTSSEGFMLRNVTALLPPGTVQASDDGEDPGKPMDIRAMEGQGAADQWLVEGRPYLLKRHPLSNTQYQLLTLASLDGLATMRRQHFFIGMLVAAIGLVLIRLSSHIVERMVMQRQADRYAAIQTSASNADLNAALKDAREKERQNIEVLGYIGHDLRAPLATIRGYSTILLADAPEKQRKMLHTIQRSVKYQLGLIEELLEYTKSGLRPLAIKPTATDLHILLDDIYEYAIALSTQQNNRFHYVSSDRLPRQIEIDGKRLQQVLLNLISNAAKFTRDGVITLSVTAKSECGICVLKFSVSDTGVGIDLDQNVDIFCAFKKIQAESGSTGLGLIISQRILSAMGESLSVTSALGKGTKFSFGLSAPVIDLSGADWPAVSKREAVSDGQLPRPHVPRDTMPGDQALGELADLALHGRFSDIESWIDGYASNADYVPFTTRLRELLEQFDFPAIHALALHNRDDLGT